MNVFKHGLHAAGWTSSRPTIWLLLPAIVLAIALTGSAEAGTATAPPLGTAQSFVVLAGAGVTDTGPTTLNGDLGTYPTTTISGTGSVTDNGTNHGGDAVTQGAKSDLVTAFTTAAGEGPTSPIVADLAGQTLTPGIYNSASSMGLSGALTLDAGGHPDAVFLFQMGSTLTTASASQITLIGGAQPCNVFWQVGSSATLGTGSSFVGTIMALTDITVTHGVTVQGRALAQTGAVTLDTDTITSPACDLTSYPDTSSATATTTTTTTATTASTATTPLPLINASATRLAATKAAKAAKAAAVKAAAAKAASGKATTAATAAAARLATARAQAAKATAAKTASAKALAAKVEAAKATSTAKTLAAKQATAKAEALRLAAATSRTTAARKAKAASRATGSSVSASSRSAPAGHARIALRTVGLTG